MKTETRIEVVPKLCLRVDECAESIGLSAPTIYELIRAHDFPAIRYGKKWVIPVEPLRRWIDEYTGDTF